MRHVLQEGGLSFDAYNSSFRFIARTDTGAPRRGTSDGAVDKGKQANSNDLGRERGRTEGVPN